MTFSIHYIRAAGSSIALDARGTAVPTILHWGADLGELSEAQLEQLADSLVPAVGPSSIDSPLRLRLLPLLTDGWSGTPGLSGYAEDVRLSPSGYLWSPALVLVAVEAVPAARSLRVVLESPGNAEPVDGQRMPRLEVVVELELAASGVLKSRQTVTNLAEATFSLSSFDVTLPLPQRASEILDFSGRWPRERQPQRRSLTDGTWLRESRHGRPGHDAAFLMIAGTPGFGFRSGEVWATHVAFSGDQRLWAESSATGFTSVGAGELLAPGEVRLARGESYSTPQVVSTWSADGIDGLTRRFHEFVRARRGGPMSPRKVIINTWEAVYFDHSVPKLIELADAAADVGAERFVLDDGWMTGRTDDKRALGDWTVDPVKWPNGLSPLIDHVVSRGMDFGLWVEPEMVSLDSATAREHPEWVLRAGAELPLPWRHQQVLDLANPDAYNHVRDQLIALLDEYPISYFKWDQNRDLLGGSTHAHTLATYRLMDELRERFPGLEIESCSSGGARADLGVLEHTDRIWASDTNDALERQSIYRWTSALVPPEYLGVHLGAAKAHTTGRTHALSFRLATALFGHAGIEWDVTRTTAEERASITTWIDVYKAHRALLHNGETVRADTVSRDDARWVHGVVAHDRSEAIFAVVATASGLPAVPAPTALPGLDPSRTYRARPIDIGAPVGMLQDAPPPWWQVGELTLPGRLLGEVGLTLPLLLPEQSLLLHVEAI